MSCTRELPPWSFDLNLCSPTAGYVWDPQWYPSTGGSSIDFLADVRSVTAVGGAGPGVSLLPALQFAAFRTKRPDAGNGLSTGSPITAAGLTHYQESVTSTDKFWFRRGSSFERRTWIGADDGPTPIFLFPDLGALQDQLQSLLSDRCVHYFVKYVEWCGTDEYALATIYCFDDDHRVVGSRVAFSRVGENPPRFFDLTGAIARSRGDEEEEGDATWSGVFGTCTPRHRSADWTPIAGGA